MTDELLYERLAISVSQLGSPLPHVHGELIPNLNQLYPLLIAPLFRARARARRRSHDAHALNAWVMSSACIPAFLLARRVTGRRLAAYARRAADGVPAVDRALVVPAHRGRRLPGVPLGGARDPASRSRRRRGATTCSRCSGSRSRSSRGRSSSVLLAVAAGRDLRATSSAAARRPARGGASAPSRATACSRGRYAVVLAAARSCSRRSASSSRVLGTYRGALEGQLVPRRHRPLVRSSTSRRSRSGSAILPFVVGIAWLLANAVRPPERDELHAFACLASVTVVAVALEVTVFDLRFGAGSRPRPLPLLRRAARAARLPLRARRRAAGRAGRCSSPAVARRRRLRARPAAAPTAIFHADSPGRDARTTGCATALHSLNGARAVPRRRDRRSRHAALRPARRSSSAAGTSPPVLAVLTLVVLPARDRLRVHAALRAQRHVGPAASRSSQGGVFDWVDRTVGRGRRGDDRPVSRACRASTWRASPRGGTSSSGTASVVRSAHYPGQFEWTPSTFPKLYLALRPARPAARTSRRRATSLQSDKETRFRISGAVVSLNRGDAADRRRASRGAPTGSRSASTTTAGRGPASRSTGPRLLRPRPARADCGSSLVLAVGGAVRRAVALASSSARTSSTNGGAGDGGRRPRSTARSTCACRPRAASRTIRIDGRRKLADLRRHAQPGHDRRRVPRSAASSCRRSRCRRARAHLPAGATLADGRYDSAPGLHEPHVRRGPVVGSRESRSAERLELLVRVAAGEELLDPGKVRDRGLAQLLAARRASASRTRRARRRRRCAFSTKPARLEPVEQPRDPRRGEQHALARGRSRRIIPPSACERRSSTS